MFILSSCEATERLFKLLGWELKDSAEDLKPPSDVFCPLGVKLDFSEVGFVTIANTDARLTKINEELVRLVSLPSCTAADIHHIVGVCQFAEAQSSGRTGASVLNSVRSAQRQSGPQKVEKLRASLVGLAEYFAATKPRVIRTSNPLPPVLLWTDAAAETSVTSFGAVLFDPVSNRLEFFGAVFRKEAVDTWKLDRITQIITQAELVAIPIAFESWRDILQDRDIIAFIDNDPAKDSLVRGSSPSAVSAAFARTTRLLAAELALAPWYARVASPSNIADAPARGDFCALLAAGALEVDIKLPASASQSSLIFLVHLCGNVFVRTW